MNPASPEKVHDAEPEACTNAVLKVPKDLAISRSAKASKPMDTDNALVLLCLRCATFVLVKPILADFDEKGACTAVCANKSRLSHVRI